MVVLWALIIGHIFLVAGCYIFSRGLLVALGSQATTREIFITKPFFWGLILVLAGFCSILAWHIQGA